MTKAIPSRFYSTYEELKPRSKSTTSENKNSFYSTYEELKLPALYILWCQSPPFLQYLWGIETPSLERIFVSHLLFLQYLWGIETFLHTICFFPLHRFLQYLWGIETWTYYFFYVWKFHVFTVPMRNWNARNALKCQLSEMVFTVPMRNWNQTCQSLYTIALHRFYSTYEELKQAKLFCISNPFVKFLQYLWGIETQMKKSCENAFIIVFTVPMRNWNISTIFPTVKYWLVFTVPMRNWNLYYPVYLI